MKQILMALICIPVFLAMAFYEIIFVFPFMTEGERKTADWKSGL
jgi:hypothetical protein